MFHDRFGNDDDGSDDFPPLDELKNRPLGRILVKMRKVTREQVIEGLDHQKRYGGKLGEVMVHLGVIQPADLLVALAAQRGERA